MTAAESIIPAAKEIIMFEDLAERFLNRKPISAPMTVAPPTPIAVRMTIYIFSLRKKIFGATAERQPLTFILCRKMYVVIGGKMINDVYWFLCHFLSLATIRER